MFGRKKAENSSDNRDHAVFREKGLIDVTNFAAMSPEDPLGYLCGCLISVSSNGIVTVYSCENENEILETFPVSSVISFCDNINNYDPEHITEVSLMTKGHDYRFSFESSEIKKDFSDIIFSFLLDAEVPADSPDLEKNHKNTSPEEKRPGIQWIINVGGQKIIQYIYNAHIVIGTEITEGPNIHLVRDCYIYLYVDYDRNHNNYNVIWDFDGPVHRYPRGETFTYGIDTFVLL